jgi:hypothetical protein
MKNASLLSLTLVSLAMLAGGIGFSSQVLAQSANSNQPAVLGGNGRFVFGQINEYNADQYMLDTQTGRLWRLVDTVDGTTSVLEPVAYALPDGRTQATPPSADDLRAPARDAESVQSSQPLEEQ